MNLSHNQIAQILRDFLTNRGAVLTDKLIYEVASVYAGSDDTPTIREILRDDLRRRFLNISDTEELERLRSVIREHRSQLADDRCIEDDDRLYAVLEDGIKCDRRVGSKQEMLHNCERFIQNRCEEGGWPSYAELKSALEKILACPWDCAAPRTSCHDIARKVLHK